RLRGLAPSARRSRRRFGAALEPLSHVRLWFYEREASELVRLSQSELVEAYWETRGELERSLALGQVVELAELLLPEREPADSAFRLLLAVLEGVKKEETLWLPPRPAPRLAANTPAEPGRCPGHAGESLAQAPGRRLGPASGPGIGAVLARRHRIPQ